MSMVKMCHDLSLSRTSSLEILQLPSDLTLSHDGVRLELLDLRYEDDLVQACQDGNLWKLLYTITPSPDEVHEYIATTHAMTDRVAFAVIDETTERALAVRVIMISCRILCALRLAILGMPRVIGART